MGSEWTQLMSNIRWRAMRASAAVASSTVIRFTTRPSTSSSSTQQRWAASMRNMGAGADERVQGHHRYAAVLVGQPLDQVDLGGDRDGHAGLLRLRLLDRRDDVVGAADLVGQFDHVMGAFRVGDHQPVRMGGPELGHMGGSEALMDGAVSLPEQEAGLLHGPLVQPPQHAPRVPNGHIGLGEAELVSRVASEVLVGEEEDFRVGAPLVEGPGEDLAGVRRGADGAPVAADERLQRGRGVHISDRHHGTHVGHLGQAVPRLLDRLEICHVGHGAAGVQVGQDHLLIGAGQDVGRLGHEVDAAEDHVLGLRLGGQPGQAERVAPGVGPAHDLVPLVVVTEDHQARPQSGLGRGQTRREIFGCGCRIALG
jgi:hypothetical protein